MGSDRMEVDELVERYPVLYHVAEKGSWPLIQNLGLLSTTAILDRFGLEGAEREVIEERRRPEAVELTHRDHGTIIIRDQRVLHDSKLSNALLDGLSTSEWHRILNRKVFFWLRRHRFHGLLEAKSYRARRHTVITVGTKALLDDHLRDVRLSRLNSGSTTPMAHPRGRDTFLPIADYDFDERKSSRGVKDAIAELTVEYAVPDAAKYALRVEEVGAGAAPLLIWERSSGP